MAKVKVKLDLAAIKSWLFDHGEKVAFGGIVLVFLLFTWSAIGRETLSADKQPDNLRQKSQAVKAHVDQSTWDAKREGVALVDYTERAKRVPLVVTTYKLPTPLSTPLQDPKAKRDDPAIFPVEELRVSSGFAIFSVKAAGEKKETNSALKAQPWAVITGLVPFKKQSQEYARLFERAMGDAKRRDEPEYAGYIIERAEVNDAQPDKLDWKALPADTFSEQWSGTTATDIVVQEFIDPNLTARLGPLVGGVQWDASVAHPKIPLASAAARAKATAAAAEAAKTKKEDVAEESDKPSTEGSRVIRRAQASDKAATPVVAAPAAEPIEVVYKLLRIFDFTVQPAKKYRYRVTLALEDPNFGVDKHMLKHPEKEHKDMVESPVSEPTGVVVIPTGNRVLAVGTAKGSPTDPAAKIMVSRIDREEGIEPAGEMDVWRGSVANFADSNLIVNNPGGGTRELSDVEIKTGVLVLDVRGGKRLSNKRDAVASPVEVLILDPQGNLSVRNELEDLSMVEFRKPKEEVKRDKDDQDVPQNNAPRARAKTKKKGG